MADHLRHSGERSMLDPLPELFLLKTGLACRSKPLVIAGVREDLLDFSFVSAPSVSKYSRFDLAHPDLCFGT